MKKPVKHFCLLESPNEQYSFVCFAMDSVRPDEYLDVLATELRKKRAVGKVLLDLLICNGDSSRRFVAVQVGIDGLAWSTARVTARSLLDAELVRFCTSFFANHVSVLEKSVLSQATKHRLKTSREECTYIV